MSGPKPKVLLLGEIEHAPAQSAYNSLSSLANLITPTSTEPADFLDECRSGAFNGTKAVYRTFQSVSITGRIEGEVVKALAEAGVRFIAHNGAGYDQIDIPSCTTHGIHVSNTAPPALTAATADTALFLLLGALRNFNPSLLSLRSGTWRGSPPAALGHDPAQKVLGILGMGGIGRNLARKAKALGMEVAYHNRNHVPEDVEKDIGVRALKTNQISSCGLDVYEHEPQIHPGLIDNPNVLLLPHMGTWTQETQTEMELWTVANVRSVLETGRLMSPVC
ncbi:MAG: hypothetical protein Q9172_001771 [Xanthocarpia lactea]